MMSMETIRSLAHQVGRNARAAGKVPYTYKDFADFEAKHGQRPIPFPNLGSYRPRRWELVDQLFVDKTGFGEAGEPALTIAQAMGRVGALVFKHVDQVGFAIIEEGQFQVYIGVFLTK